MIEKTRKKQHCPYLHVQRYILGMTVLLMTILFSSNFTTLSAQECAAPTNVDTMLDLVSDCSATTAPQGGEVVAVTVEPGSSYEFTICDPTPTTASPQPYAEIYDDLGGNFESASVTDANGCAVITYTNCDDADNVIYLSVTSVHGASMCDDDWYRYSMTTTCIPTTFTCPSTTPFKVNLSDASSCCYSGLIPIPDLSTNNCADAATLAIEYTDCNGGLIATAIALPDTDNAYPVELPLGVNNVNFIVTIGGVSVTCPTVVTVTKSIACASSVNIGLDASCATSINPSIFSSQTCNGTPYAVAYTVNGAAVSVLNETHIGASNIVATVTDPHGNSCSTSINLMDNVGPKLVCPSSATLICGQSTDVADLGMATATDCSGFDGNITFIDGSSIDCSGEVITRTFYATDNNGVTANCAQTITLEPIVLNGIICAPSYIDDNETGPNEMTLSSTDFPITAPPTSGDLMGMTANGMELIQGTSCNYRITFTDEIIPNCGGAYDIVRTWTILDWCNPTTAPFTCPQFIKVRDTENPEGVAGTVTFQNESIECQSTVTVGAATFTDTSDMEPDDYTITLTGTGTTYSAAINSQTAVFENVPMGAYDATWCATDECGNQGCVTTTFTITDNLSPLAVCDNKTLSINNSSSINFCAQSFDDGSIDNCGIVAYKIKRLDGNAADPFTDCVSFDCTDTDAPVMLILRVYDQIGTFSSSDDLPANDNTLRFSQCMQSVTIDDKTCPTCPNFPDVNITCEQELTDGAGFIVDPNAEGMGAGELNENTDNCNMFTFADGGLTDSNGNAITDLPTCGGLVYQNWILSATNFNGCLPQTCQQRITISSTTWDGDNNIDFPNDVTVECESISDISDPDPSELPVGSQTPIILDNTGACGNIFTARTSSKVFSGSSDGCYVVTRTWKVFDECAFEGDQTNPIVGEAGFFSQTQRVTILDTEAPMFTSTISDLTIESCNDLITLPALPTGSDNCDSAVAVSSDQDVVFGTPDAAGNYTAAEGTFTVTYTATDNCGNEATGSIEVTVVSPEIDLTCLEAATTDVTVSSCNNEFTLATMPTLCDDLISISSDQNMVFGAPNANGNFTAVDGVYLVTYTTTDVCGNMGTVSFNVTVVSSTFDLTCLEAATADVTLMSCNSEITLPAIPTLCDDLISITSDQDVIFGAPNANDTHTAVDGSYTVTYSTTDVCGNMGTVSIEVTVVSTPIDLTCLEAATADVTLMSCDSEITLPALPTPCDDLVTITSDQDVIFGAPNAQGNHTAIDGSYTVTYSTTDVCGNVGTVSIEVTVVSTPIDLTCLEAATSNITVNSCVNRFTLPAIPGLCGDLVSITSNQNAVFGAPDGTGTYTAMDGVYTVTYTATDVCNNTNGVSIQVTVVSSEPDFDLTSEYVNGCNAVATVSNFTINGTAANASDFNIAWPGSTGCGNVTTCSNLDPGSYDVIVTNLLSGCATTKTVVVDPMVIGIQTTFTSPCMLLFNEIRINNVMVTDLTGYAISLEVGGLVVATFTNNNSSFVGTRVNQTYTLRVITPLGCEETAFVMTCMPSPRIAGFIANEEGDELEEVSVKISDAILPTNTDQDGLYEFNDLEIGNNYTVTPTKNVDPLNGVTTYDLVLISQHILGVNQLDSPYKMIAADVNNSNSITTLDVVKIQKLILGIDTDFAPVDSWCFVDAGFSFPNSANPFQSTFPEIYPLNNLEVEHADVDFVGVKIGDVNCSANPNQNLQVANRNNPKLDFEIQNQQFNRGETIEVDFTSESFEAMFGFQFTFQFDNDLLEFVNIKSGALDQLSTENFGFGKVEDGLITASWFNHQATTLKTDEVIFTMVFEAKESGDLSETFDITSGITANEIYRATTNNTIEQLNVDLTVNGSIEKSKEVTLFQNSPNPFREATTIQFYLPEADEASILIFDYSGKLITEINRRFEKGMNEVSIDKGMLDTKGILFYQLESKQFTATKKMLFVE